jgi:hypothetical protein
MANITPVVIIKMAKGRLIEQKNTNQGIYKNHYRYTRGNARYGYDND